MDTGTNVFIITLLVVKKLHMTIRMSDRSKIITVDQIRKNVISIIKDISLLVQDARIPVNLLVIDVSENNLLLGIDWINQY